MFPLIVEARWAQPEYSFNFKSYSLAGTLHDALASTRGTSLIRRGPDVEKVRAVGLS